MVAFLNTTGNDAEDSRDQKVGQSCPFSGGPDVEAAVFTLVVFKLRNWKE